MKKWIMFVLLILGLGIVVGYGEAEAQTTTPLIASFYTSAPCNPMIAGEITFFSHSTGNPTSFLWTVVCPDGTIIISQNKTPKFDFSMLGEYDVSLTVSRQIDGKTDTLAVPRCVKVVSNSWELHPPYNPPQN